MGVDGQNSYGSMGGTVNKQARAAALELLRRKKIKESIVNGLHDVQRAVYEDPSQYRAVCASRRGGKTHLIVSLITLDLIDCDREVWVLYIAQTSQIGKELIFQELIAMNEKYDLGWEIKEHPSVLITTPVGGKFRIVGLDDVSALGKIRGKKYKGVYADECKEYTKHLRELVEEIVSPAFLNVGGRMIIAGTPGRVCSETDYWFAAANGLTKQWSAHHWTIRDNKWVLRPEEELAKVREQNGWSEHNVVYQREYEGRWVSSDDERVYAYNRERNSVPTLPENFSTTNGEWVSVVGVDYAFSPDDNAWVVMASHKKSKDVYVVHAEARGRMLPDEVSEHTANLIKRFRPQYVVGDSGGLGKVLVEHYNQRYAARLNMWIQPADKRNKRDHQELLSEELKTGRIKVCMDVAGDLAGEWARLTWESEDRLKENPNQPNHMSDAALYAYVKHKAFYHKPDPPPLSELEKQAAERRERAKRIQARNSKGLLR